jgi:hypothetical protein
MFFGNRNKTKSKKSAKQTNTDSADHHLSNQGQVIDQTQSMNYQAFPNYENQGYDMYNQQQMQQNVMAGYDYNQGYQNAMPQMPRKASMKAAPMQQMPMQAMNMQHINEYDPNQGYQNAIPQMSRKASMKAAPMQQMPMQAMNMQHINEYDPNQGYQNVMPQLSKKASMKAAPIQQMPMSVQPTSQTKSAKKQQPIQEQQPIQQEQVIMTTEANIDNPENVEQDDFDTGDDLNGAVRVVVRVRPPNAMEYRNGYVNGVYCETDNRTLNVVGPDGIDRPLTFNRVYDQDVKQDRFFEESGIKELIGQALEGYSVCVFAFGQTGSGKNQILL